MRKAFKCLAWMAVFLACGYGLFQLAQPVVAFPFGVIFKYEALGWAGSFLMTFSWFVVLWFYGGWEQWQDPLERLEQIEEA